MFREKPRPLFDFASCFTLRAYVNTSKGEVNMPKRCVINATQLKSVDKSSLGKRIGGLSHEKMDQLVSGLKLVMDIP